MGWETRGNGHRYLYRKSRDSDGRVRSVYLGRDEVCHALEEVAHGRRLEASIVLRRLREALAPLDAALASVLASEARVRRLRDAYLVATGHRPHRGQWRRRRGAHAVGSPYARPFLVHSTAPLDGADAMSRKKPSRPDPMPIGAGLSSPETGILFHIPKETDEVTRQDIADAAQACLEAPSDATATRLRVALSHLPAWAFFPYADRMALRAASVLLVGNVGAASAGVEAEAERFAAELADGGGPLVRAAASHASLARVVLDAVLQSYGRTLRGSYTLKEGDHFEKRLNSAQTRYLRALATVAALQRAESEEAARAALLEAVDVERLGTGRMQLLGEPRKHSGDSLPSEADVELVAAPALR